MGDQYLRLTTNSNADSAESPNKTRRSKWSRSRAGFQFDENGPMWALDNNINVNVGRVRLKIAPEIEAGYISTLAHYAKNLSSSHTNIINERMYCMMRDTGARVITTAMLINYRSTLTRATEWHLGTIKGFFCKWHDLGYPGIDADVIALLKSWRLKGSIKGDVVKRLDPTKGPLTDNELQAFNESAARAFEQNLISITELSISLLVSHTGRRPKQISHLKIVDLDDTKKNKNGEPLYLLHIPRAKQRYETFRESFKSFAMVQELWTVLAAQREHCIRSVQASLNFELQESDRLSLPLFPDVKKFLEVKSVVQLRRLLQSERLHIKWEKVTDILQKVVKLSGCCSERTGKLLAVAATRFRYTTGTRAAREGFGRMVIAELLDHTDIQNTDVYIKNVPEYVAALDKALGHQLAVYAKAFQGVLVESEQDARRGSELTSRVRHKGKGAGTCGTYGFCGANVPIPCYTCMHFQPWLNGPHEEIYDFLIKERERILAVTGDAAVAAANDRSILAVAEVIQQCILRRKELQRKLGK